MADGRPRRTSRGMTPVRSASAATAVEEEKGERLPASSRAGSQASASGGASTDFFPLLLIVPDRA
jgi:hypothetical protein